MPQGQLAYITFIDQGAHPDHGLPGGRPPRPGQLPSRPGRPVDPDYGLGEESPDQGLPEPPAGVWPPPGPSHPIVPLPPDVDLPPGTIWPPLPEHAQGKFVVLVWIGGEGEHAGFHYTVVDTNLKPDQGLPGGEGEDGGEYPDQGLPSPQPPRPGQRPPQPGQGLPRPPVAGQPHPGNRPPGSTPPRPGQGLPPTAQPKR